ncbi:peptidylprolyl isomerase [Paenibacillus sp. TAF58]
MSKRRFSKSKQRSTVFSMILLTMLGLFFSDGKGNIDDGKKTAALSRLEQVVRELKSGKTLNEEIALLKNEAFFRIDADEQTFDGTFKRADYQVYGTIRQTADKLDSGQTSDIFEFGGAYYIIKLLEREDRGFKDFESVKNDVREQYLDSKYEDTVSEWARQAEVTINHNVYDRLKVR